MAGYFETVEKAYIKEAAAGEKIFYPGGALGRKGYLVPSPEIEKKLRTRIRLFTVLIIVSAAVIAAFIGNISGKMTFYGYLLYIAVFTALFYAVNVLFFLDLTRKMARVKTPNSLLLYIKNSLSAAHPALLFFGAFISAAFSLAGFAFFFKSHDPKMLLSAGIFILILIPYLMAFYYRANK